MITINVNIADKLHDKICIESIHESNEVLYNILIHKVHEISGIDNYCLKIVSNMTNKHDIVENIIETKQMMIEYNSTFTPLCMALLNNNYCAARKWLNIECDVDYVCGDSTSSITPLISALLYCPSMFMMILSCTTDVNITDFSGSTALHYAVKLDEPNHVKFLLYKNARIDIYNHMNMAPINYASNNNMTGLVMCN